MGLLEALEGDPSELGEANRIYLDTNTWIYALEGYSAFRPDLTQYTDMVDFLRAQFQQLYGTQLACYSGCGGELLRGDEWVKIPKASIKQRFRNGDIKILLCTESGSSGIPVVPTSCSGGYVKPNFSYPLRSHYDSL